MRILSGVFEGRTTGTPIALVIHNEDAQEPRLRPDQGDLPPPAMPTSPTTRSTASATIAAAGGPARARPRCASPPGAIARKILGDSVTIRGAVIRIGGHAVDRARWDWAETARNPLFCPDAETVPAWEEALDAARKAGTSLGAVIEVEATGVPAGLGAPVYGKMDADLAAAMMGINAVKGVEIGAGFAAAAMSGDVSGDEIRMEGDTPRFLTNNAGGTLGGITTGQPVVVRFAVKPTSSIRSPRRTITRSGAETEVSTAGRHDPCVGIRAVPVGEAMMACVLADHLLRHRAQCG